MTVKRFFKKLMRNKRHPDESLKSILIVDDDEDLRDNLKDILETEGYETFFASTRAEASEVARDILPWVALVDLKLPDGMGTALLSDLKRVKPDCVCMLMTAYADVESAVAAMEKGAFYYIRKPVKPDELLELVELAFETIRLKQEKVDAEEALKARNKELEETLARLRNVIGEE